MNLGDLVIALEDILFDEEHLIMVLPYNGPPLYLKGVRAERHENADGSTTVWIEAEEI